MAKASGGTRSGNGGKSVKLAFGADKKANLKMITDDFWEKSSSEKSTIHFGRGRKNIEITTYKYSLGGYNATVTSRSDQEGSHLVIKDSKGKTRVDRNNTGVLSSGGMLSKELFSLITKKKSLKE